LWNVSKSIDRVKIVDHILKRYRRKQFRLERRISFFQKFHFTLWSISMYAVAGLLVVVGGVVNDDETDRVWSEALFALTCCSSNQ
jgi:hypothetical protein